ncbi:hypothetical protein BDQ17DRAFT_1377169 [Cyathus striatus]|nr:hypothetical protein BDQ17DRAFT_1377169 [Cyathus striatus]
MAAWLTSLKLSVFLLAFALADAWLGMGGWVACLCAVCAEIAAQQLCVLCTSFYLALHCVPTYNKAHGSSTWSISATALRSPSSSSSTSTNITPTSMQTNVVLPTNSSSPIMFSSSTTIVMSMSVSVDICW